MGCVLLHWCTCRKSQPLYYINAVNPTHLALETLWFSFDLIVTVQIYFDQAFSSVFLFCRLFFELSESLFFFFLFLSLEFAHVELALRSIVFTPCESFTGVQLVRSVCVCSSVCVYYLCIWILCITADRVNSVWWKAWTALICDCWPVPGIGRVPACQYSCMTWQSLTVDARESGVPMRQGVALVKAWCSVA